jgi:uncharacterized protein (TIGR03790 family)
MRFFPLRLSGIALHVVALTGLVGLSVASADPGSEVLVIYNSRLPESKAVAEYYASRRVVPADQVWGLELPLSETLSRAEFNDRMQQPLLRKLEESKLWVLSPPTNKLSEPRPGGGDFRRVLEAKVRYAALCYGVPVRILKDPSLVEAGQEKLPPELRRNEAAVDSELANLPRFDIRFPLAGPLPSPHYGSTNEAMLDPTNGIFLVTRLDGPSPAIARGLVDKAIEAETNGLWGRAYFDARGLPTNSSYLSGDLWIRGAAEVARRFGFETVLDDQPATFSAGFPLSQVALYAGWYDGSPSGPFAQNTVEFVPGAFAYHLYSFSAQTIRSVNNSWVGTFLKQGATCTLGAVDEPYLAGTPDIFTFISRLTFFGFTFGEASYAAQSSLSWQTTCIGDPLYRPFGRNLDELHRELEQRQSPLADWSYLLRANRSAANGGRITQVVNYLEAVPAGRPKTAVLSEKLGDLYWVQNKFTDALDMWEAALKRNPSPQQKIRLLLKLAEKRAVVGPDAKSLEVYRHFLRDYPNYPDLLKVYEGLLVVAKRMNRKDVVEHCEAEIKGLSPATAEGK